jgi:hypothetical protein
VADIKKICRYCGCVTPDENEIRARAIEEFAERLITNAESFQAEVNGIRADLMTHDYFMEFVDEIAESMRK